MSDNQTVKKISIIGAGSWGTAIAKVIADSNPKIEVLMWSYEKSTAASINSRNMNDEFLPSVKLPGNIKATTNLKDSIEETDGIILATPSKALPEIVGKISKYMKDIVPMSYLTKGFCRINNNIFTISQAISSIWPEYKNRIVAIYGPSHAEEVTKNYHTCLNVASHSSKDSHFFYRIFSSEFLQCRITDDIIGVDVGGTLKNPAAIAAGMISILPHCGDNLTGALIAESLKEMVALGVVIGAKEKTIIDISGTGDLVATALSEHSRNRRFGQDIAKQIVDKGFSLGFSDRLYLKFKPELVLEKMSKDLHYLAEGAYAIEPLIELADKYNVPIPVYRSLYEVLLNKKDPMLLIETIKNPDKFEDIYHNVKIHIKEKTKGLEGVKGRAFKRIIKDQIVAKYVKSKDDELNEEIRSEIISNLKEHLENNLGENSSVFYKDEISYIKSIDKKSYNRFVSKLVSLYLNEIMDDYSSFCSSVRMKLLNLKYYFNKMRGLRNEIKTHGDIESIQNLKQRANIVYITKYKNSMDQVHYLLEMYRKKLPVPRFFISNESSSGNLSLYFQKKSGGFIVNKEKFDNSLYRECLVHYLTSLISHGVPILYSPYFENKSLDMCKDINESFLSLINDVLFRETTEIALIPSQIKYIDRVDESLPLPPFKDSVIVKFSSPLYLSDLTKESNSEMSLAQMIKDTWKRDRVVLSYHIISRFFRDEDYVISSGSIKKIFKAFLRDFDPRRSSKQTLNEGLKFLLKKNFITKDDDSYVVINKVAIDKYAKVIDQVDSP